MPIKPLVFKGDKKPKKRKHHETSSTDNPRNPSGTDEDDTWTLLHSPSDLTGPTLLILPTVPPTTLSSDANGTIFASRLENILEPDLPETAEPHDVRQVWVASQIPGGSAGQVSFKGSHGGYLSCDSHGILGARREARSVEEGFRLEYMTEEEDGIRRKKGRWRVMCVASSGEEEGEKRYLAAVTQGGLSKDEDEEEEDADTVKKGKQVSISLRGDGVADSPSTSLILKMQARFLPQRPGDGSGGLTGSKEHKTSRKELEVSVGRRLDDDEVKRLKRAKKEGRFHEEVLDVRVKGKHDKFA